jgi:hypothetical protein
MVSKYAPEPVEQALARPGFGRDVPTLVEDEQSKARQRFLDELIGRPPAGPSKLEVIRDPAANEKTVKPKDPTTIAAEYRDKAAQKIEESHRKLQFNSGPFEPRAISPKISHVVAEDCSALSLSKERLGANATKEQLEAYAQCVLKLNKKEGSTADAVFKKDSTIALPGQRADGALTYRKNGISVSEWYDGSRFEVSERGKGRALIKTADGGQTEVKWNPEQLNGNKETTSKDDKQTECSPSGTCIEKTKVEEKGKTKWEVTKLTTLDSLGRTLVADFEAGKKEPAKVTITDKDKTVITLGPDGKGEYVGDKKDGDGKVIDSDVHAIPTRQGFTIYSEKDNGDKTRTRKYENGTEEQLNEDADILKRTGKDEWGRKVTEEYEAGEGLPYKISVTPKDGKPIEFNLKPFGHYEATLNDSDGKSIGTIDLRRNGLLVYNNDKDQTATCDLPDGTHMVRKKFADARQEITETKEGATLRRTIDREGVVVDAEYTGSDGRKFYRKLASDGQSVDSVTLTDKENCQTTLKYDRDLGVFNGERKDPKGQPLERAFYFQGKLVYTDIKTGEARFEKLKLMEKDLFGMHISRGVYDPLSGTIATRNGDGTSTIESFAPGRTDTINGDTITGSTITGESSRVQARGETVVHRPDDSGVRLNRDGTVDRWGPSDDDNAAEEPLIKAEGEYLRNHPDADRRDILAVHAQFHNKPELVSNFYKAMNNIDTVKNLSDVERKALRHDLLHHVAHPEELYQGNSWMCNVAVCERDMAMNMPDKYVNLVVGALSEGSLKLPNGDTLPVDKCNLRQVDSSGRDFVTRVFHTVGIQAKYYPKYTFTNTEDGVGRLVPADENARPAAFVGLDMEGIADVRHKLTGEKKAVVNVTSVDELLSAFEKNAARSLIVAVNAEQPPFSSGNELSMLFAGQTESAPNHVVTVTRVDAGPPVKLYVQNQWGLKNDLSTPETAVDAEMLLHSMLGRVRNRQGDLVQTPAQVLSAGEPGKTYFFKDGELVEEKRRK